MQIRALLALSAVALCPIGCSAEGDDGHEIGALLDRDATPSDLHLAYYIDYAANRPDVEDLQPMTAASDIRWDASERAWVVDAPSTHVLIENRVFFPEPGAYALVVRNNGAYTVEIKNCLFWGGYPQAEGGTQVAQLDATVAPSNGWGIRVEDSSSVHVHHNRFENIERVAVDVQGSASPTRMDNIAIYKNSSIDMQAYDVTNVHVDPDWPIKWESKFIQFGNVYGSDNLIWENRALNLPGWSFSTDFINLYQTSGISEEQPLSVVDNKVVGAGESTGAGGLPTGSYHLQGAGIQLADHAALTYGGQWINASRNTLVYPGRAGININGGWGISMSHNTIIMADSLFGYDMNCDPNLTAMCGGDPLVTTLPPWTAMSVHNYSGTAGDGLINGNHTASHNRVECSTCSGGPSGLPDDPAIVVAGSNEWNASLDPAIEAPPANFFRLSP